MASKPKIELTPEQVEALDAFRKLHGRNWKSELNICWMRAGYPGMENENHGAILQGLRNTHCWDGVRAYEAMKERSA